jgi:hypothetical protein
MALAQRVLLCDVTKPSFILHTLLLFAYAAAIVVVRHFPWRDGRPLVLRMAHTIHPLLILLVPVVFLAIPYYALVWQHVADYVWSNTRGDNAKFWRLPTGFLGSIWFYLAGPPAKEMMKSHLIIAPCLVALGFAIAIARKESYQFRYALLVLGAAALSLLTFGIARMGNPFFGLTSQLLISFLAIYFIGSIWNVPETWLRPNVRTIAVVAVLVGIAGIMPNPATYRPPQTPVNAVQFSINRDVVQTVHGYALENDLRGTDGLGVLVTFAGDVSDAAMKWVALKAGLRYQFSSVAFSDSINTYIDASKIAAFLVAADRDVAGVAQWLPSNKIADKILGWVQTQSDWSLVRAIEAYDGLNYFVFVNSKNIRPFRNLVRLGEKTDGFLNIEGAYPEGLGVVRWGTAPESNTVFCLDNEEERVLELSGRSIPGQILTVLLNGTEQLRHTFKTHDFEDITVPLVMTKGDNQLTLRYTTHFPVSPDNLKRAVLFRQISLLPAERTGPQVGHTHPEINSKGFVSKYPTPERSRPAVINHSRASQSNAQPASAAGSKH